MESPDKAWQRRHAIKEASQTLEYIVTMIEEGFDFKSADGPSVLKEMKKVCKTLRQEYEIQKLDVS